MTHRNLHAVGLALAISTLAGAALAACPPGLPPGVVCGVPDPRLATAGVYKLDETHASVIARVSHIGYSLSVFRFDKVEGTLAWDPANPAASKLTVSVAPASIATPVKGFAAELAGKEYLNTAAFPTATFVSTAFRQTDATHGQVAGQLTLLGKTAPLTFDVTLVGAGPGFGAPRMGIQARAMLQPQDHGMSPFFIEPIELVVDAEFAKQP